MFTSPVGPEAMLLVFGVLAVIAVACASWLGVRNRDPLPLAACMGALICSLNEPIYDVLGKLVYAKVPSGYVAYSAFGRQIPWSLVLGYVPWVGIVPYILSRMMASGVSRSRIYALAAGLTGSVGLVEVINALWMHGWRYYAPESGRGVLAGGIIQMASMPILCAFMYFAFADRFTGIRRALCGIVMPPAALPAVFAATSWPLYVSNYATVSQAVRWAAAVVTTGFCVLSVIAVSYLAERWRGRTTSGSIDVDARAALDRNIARPPAGARSDHDSVGVAPAARWH